MNEKQYYAVVEFSKTMYRLNLMGIMYQFMFIHEIAKRRSYYE